MDYPSYVSVVDPLTRSVYPAALERTEEGFALHRTDADVRPDVYLSPGWIDLHAHVYDGVADLSVPADAIGLATGVHLIADAGSAGEGTIRGLREYVAPRFETEIRSWLNISSIGLAHIREFTDLSLIDIDKTVSAAVGQAPFVCGIKVRSSGAIVGKLGLIPLQMALLAASEAGLPLMVHIGEAPPLIDDVLHLLREGDVVTHCFHGKTGHPWQPGGTPGRALQQALERGVILDVGHGAASFSFDICRNALNQGLSGVSISTDAHIRNINGPVYSLAVTMTKLMYCGMSLCDVIAGVTAVPAGVLRMNDWCRLEGTLAKATLFRIADGDASNVIYSDAGKSVVRPKQIIEPTAVITGNLMKKIS
ncbi:amidohydrolase/deacetylase family metallohydrolase [Paenibacillus humicola]|uniref:amidohydrolase/deacetylase family metallohydrolase n=1 Tax=Paenibacillus humicola TaxID=3110540 RepID=UPI00237BA912|nr:amidohydrolase/deacetylase family metallohydrolase [Paenibacillus humicola]